MAAYGESLVPVPTHKMQSGEGTRVLDAGTLKKRALNIVYRYTLLSGGGGLVAAPLFDQVVVGGLLAKMLHDLCKLYGIKVTDHKVKVITITLIRAPG